MGILIYCAVDELEYSLHPGIGREAQGRPFEKTGGLCTRLLDELENEPLDIEICLTIPELLARFHRPQPAPAVLILVIDKRKTLETLISIKDLFEGIPNIVVFAGANHQALRQTYALSPRFVAHGDKDFGDLTKVLVNLMAR